MFTNYCFCRQSVSTLPTEYKSAYFPHSFSILSRTVFARLARIIDACATEYGFNVSILRIILSYIHAPDIDCKRDSYVFGDLKIYRKFRGARLKNRLASRTISFFLFLSGTLWGSVPPPPPIPKSWLGLVL